MLPATPYTSNALIALGDASSDATSTYVVGVTGSGAFTLTPRGRVSRSTHPLDGTAPTLYTENRSTGAPVASNQITAAGVYAVAADGVDVLLDLVVTSGSVSVAALPVRG